MMSKCFILLSALVAACSAGNIAVPVAPAAAALTVGTYASTYNSHGVQHHAAPVVASYAAPAYQAYSAPAYPAYPAYSAYSAYPAAAPLSAAYYSSYAAAPASYPAYSAYSAYPAAPAILAARR